MQAANRLLQPTVLARLGTLELVSRTVVDGLLTGLHRSPHFGFSQEFAEYRAYNEGDDLRFVDWNVYARTDRTYIKRYRGETNTSVTLLLDASASMNYGEPVSKIEQGKFLAACLAYLTRRQHDALGLVIFDDKVREFLPPSAKPDSLIRTLAMLEHASAGSGTDVLVALDALRATLHKRGLIILISDLYADADDLIDVLQPMAHAGHDLAVFHVLDREELEPTLTTISALRDLETDDTVIVDPVFLQGRYRQSIQQHCDALQNSCARMGADYVRIMTDEPLDECLHQYLRFRQRKAR